MHTRVAIALALAGLAVGMGSSAAFASGGYGTTTASCDPLASTCTVGVSTPGTNGGGGGSVTCTWSVILDPLDWFTTEPVVSYGHATPGASPNYYQVSCSNGYAFEAIVYPGVGGQVGQEASSELNLPLPQISTSPAPPVPAVINLPIYLTVDAAAWPATPISATATVGGVSATATATPSYVRWSISDGRSTSCNGPGVPYNGSWGATPPPASTGACTYTFAWPDQPGTYSISATVYYHVTWTSTGVAGGGDLGMVPGPTATIPVTVDQIRSIITSG